MEESDEIVLHAQPWGCAFFSVMLSLLLIGPCLNIWEPDSDLAFSVGFAVAPALVILAAIWVVLGEHSWSARLLLVTVVVGSASASMFFSVTWDGGAVAFTPLYVLITSCVPLLLLRATLHWRISTFGQPERRQIQFGVKHLLVVTFLFAVALALLRAFAETLRHVFHDSDLMILLLLLGSTATCVGVAACCSALAQRPVAMIGGVAFGVAATVIEIVLVDQTVSPPSNAYIAYLVGINVTIWLVDTLLVFGMRAAGLRLYRG